MAISRRRYTKVDNTALKSTLLALEDYLDLHYFFRTEKKYQGFFGKMKASLDRDDIEQKEQKQYGSKLITLYEPDEDDSDVMGSDFDSAEALLGSLAGRRRRAMREYQKKLSEAFSPALFRLIAARRCDPVAVYKKARIDRKLFSKIRSSPAYIPSKKTVLAFALALELNLEETNSLLATAGFTLSHSLLFDLTIEFCIVNSIYNFDEINTLLYAQDQPLF